jgi:long-chain acyl-CoA synthetase
MIIPNGYNVYAREVEEVLNRYPEVISATVSGVAHEVHGQEVAAAVVPAPGSMVTAEQLAEYVRAQIAAYKYPRIIKLIPELPMGRSGKILKGELTAQYAGSPTAVAAKDNESSR